MTDPLSSWHCLRNEPIGVNSGSALEIPTIEEPPRTSGSRAPLVSVCMLAYNHESFIRTAIEGVLNQETDFDIELVIGEDHSTDRTLEVCRSCQRADPNRVRILWWSENLRRVRHPAGGNLARTLARCRGEYIAICEGDDYWTDRRKLQKQVDVLRNNPGVGLVYADCLDHQESLNCSVRFAGDKIPPGRMTGLEFIRRNIYGSNGAFGPECFVRTNTVLMRASLVNAAKDRLDILRWRLRLGDVPLWLACAMEADVYYLNDIVAVYRKHAQGACATLGLSLWKDNLLARLYFYDQCRERLGVERPTLLAREYVRAVVGSAFENKVSLDAWWQGVSRSPDWSWILSLGAGWYLKLLLRLGLARAWTYPLPMLKKGLRRAVMDVGAHSSLFRPLLGVAYSLFRRRNRSN